MRKRTTNITKWSNHERIKVPITINIYKCGLCGKERHVRTYPKSKCSCRVKFPNKYMYKKCIIKDFIVWVYQNSLLLVKKEWK